MNVKYGRQIKAINGIPSLHIHSKVHLCQFGDNVTLRSNLDCCWNSKIDITVKKDAILIWVSNPPSF